MRDPQRGPDASTDPDRPDPERVEPPGTISDAGETVRRVLDGDRDAFRELVEHYEPSVFGLCFRLLGSNRSDAEEIAQETFIRAYTHLAQLDDARRFAPWLYQIARSLCRDRRRRYRSERKALAARAEELQQGWSQPKNECADLNGLLDELPAAERDILILRYFDGLSYRELATRLNVSFSKVDHLIRTARARLERRARVRLSHEGRL